MGLAIIVPSISFEDANLGKVTLSGNVPIRSLSIDLEDSYVGTTVDLKCSYIPANTTQRGVVWSIESGSEYATISGSVLTILSGANSDEVVVKCTSASNQSISATKTIMVTYNSGDKQPLQWIKTGYGNYVDTGLKLNIDCIYTIYWICDTTLTSQPIGVRDISSSTSDGMMAVTINNEFRVRLFTQSINYRNLLSGENGKVLKTVFDNINGTITTIDVATDTVLQTANGKKHNTTNNIYLFCMNNNGTPETKITDSIIKRFTVEENDNVVFDLKPYLYDGTPVFIDEISDTTFNINGTNEIDYE